MKLSPDGLPDGPYPPGRCGLDAETAVAEVADGTPVAFELQQSRGRASVFCARRHPPVEVRVPAAGAWNEVVHRERS